MRMVLLSNDIGKLARCEYASLLSFYSYHNMNFIEKFIQNSTYIPYFNQLVASNIDAYLRQVVYFTERMFVFVYFDFKYFNTLPKK